uniref:Putative ovule protein n=1 Tax=Solanum chacoense TaxID=4108 RepID=A0A0V0GPB6_SOLCH
MILYIRFIVRAFVLVPICVYKNCCAQAQIHRCCTWIHSLIHAENYLSFRNSNRLKNRFNGEW